MGKPMTNHDSRPCRPAPPSADWQSIKSIVANWAEAPRRDPFRSRTDPQNQAARFLTLQAVWRQTGSNLAVINDRRFPKETASSISASIRSAPIAFG